MVVSSVEGTQEEQTTETNGRNMFDVFPPKNTKKMGAEIPGVFAENALKIRLYRLMMQNWFYTFMNFSDGTSFLVHSWDVTS